MDCFKCENSYKQLCCIGKGKERQDYYELYCKKHDDLVMDIDFSNCEEFKEKQ